jgi:hypothetical protein
MMTFARLLVVPLLVLALSVGSSVSAAAAASGYSLFGDATLVNGNSSPTGVQLNSDMTAAQPFGGIDFDVAAGMTFAQLVNLSTDYDFTHNSCAGGSPRFQINIGGHNAFVYIGPPPSYTGCAQNVWVSGTNLATPTGFIDTSQLGGTFYDTFANAYTKYGSMTVTGIQLVADGGWAFADGIQTVVVDNVQINSTTYTFESAASCKAGGWQNFSTAPGPFRNQGDCVSYFATAGKNAPNP